MKVEGRARNKFHLISDQVNNQSGDDEHIETDVYDEILDQDVTNSSGGIRNGKCNDYTFYSLIKLLTNSLIVYVFYFSHR